MSRLYDRLFAALLVHVDPRTERIYGERKRTLFAGISGTVLEIGPGSGINLEHFPRGTRWIGVEPNVYLHRFIRQRAERLGIPIQLLSGKAEHLDLPDASVDAVVSTLVLCSVTDPGQVLSEIRRVLRPGGGFYFIEHVAAPQGTGLRRLQRLIRPCWKCLADGCHPDRETDRVLAHSGFAGLEIERFEAPLPVVTPHIVGTGTRGR